MHNLSLLGLFIPTFLTALCTETSPQAANAMCKDSVVVTLLSYNLKYTERTSPDKNALNWLVSFFCSARSLSATAARSLSLLLLTRLQKLTGNVLLFYFITKRGGLNLEKCAIPLHNGGTALT